MKTFEKFNWKIKKSNPKEKIRDIVIGDKLLCVVNYGWTLLPYSSTMTDIFKKGEYYDVVEISRTHIEILSDITYFFDENRKIKKIFTLKEDPDKYFPYLYAYFSFDPNVKIERKLNPEEDPFGEEDWGYEIKQ